MELEQTTSQGKESEFDSEQDGPTSPLPDNIHDDTTAESLSPGHQDGTQSAAHLDSPAAVSQPGETSYSTSEKARSDGEPLLRCSGHLRKKPDGFG